MMPGFDRGCATLAVVAFTCVVASVLQVSGQVQDAIALEWDSAVERRLDRVVRVVTTSCADTPPSIV